LAVLTSAPASFERLREQVERMVGVVESFADVEREIDDTKISEDRKAALWLVAWSLNSSDHGAPPQLVGD
jgi:hypothetical protein